MSRLKGILTTAILAALSTPALADALRLEQVGYSQEAVSTLI